MSANNEHIDWGKRQLLWTPRRILLLAFILGCIVSGMVLMGAWNSNLAANNCARINRISMRIQTTELQALAKIGTKGQPGYTYYKEHPDELRAARLEIKGTIQDFAPFKCSIL